MILSGTGSSKATRTGDVHLWIRNEMRARQPSLVISGGALGWDAALAYCAAVEGIPYKLVLPSKDYGAYYWKDHAGAFRRMLHFAASVEYVRPSHIGANGKPGHANFDRNARLVELADEFLVYDAGSPGTRHCVGLIRKAGKTMVGYPVEREQMRCTG